MINNILLINYQIILITIVDLIIVELQLFGGRDWSMTGNSANNTAPETSIAKRAASMRFRKKKSVASVSVRLQEQNIK